MTAPDKCEHGHHDATPIGLVYPEPTNSKRKRFVAQSFAFGRKYQRIFPTPDAAADWLLAMHRHWRTYIDQHAFAIDDGLKPVIDRMTEQMRQAVGDSQ